MLFLFWECLYSFIIEDVNQSHNHRHRNCPQNTNFRGRETDFLQRKILFAWKINQWYIKEEEKKGSTSFGSTPNTHKTWSMFTCSYCLSWLCNFQHSRLLLLSQAGNRLECSHSYTLLHYVSAEKKSMLQKF